MSYGCELRDRLLHKACVTQLTIVGSKLNEPRRQHEHALPMFSCPKREKMGNACACMSKSPTVGDTVNDTERVGNSTEAVREAAPGGVYTPSPSHKRKRREPTKSHDSAPSDSLRVDALEASVQVRVWSHTPLVHHAGAERDSCWTSSVDASGPTGGITGGRSDFRDGVWRDCGGGGALAA